ncbi:MAG: hypothetical protein JST54_35645 [Deltaproteobacteria bacterium]|nr:hypothetical protein [Deltaproteobacteria bacterium]
MPHCALARTASAPSPARCPDMAPSLGAESRAPSSASPSTPDAGTSRQRTALLIGLALAVLLGAVLRFTWNEDMEFKGDESWLFQRAMNVGRTEPWPDLGQVSGVGLRNPGLSVWLFAGIDRLFDASTPLQLDRGVVTLNVLAMGLLAVFIWRNVAEDQREAWCWAALIAAVNPIVLLLDRKIWTLSAFPIFCVAFIWTWWRRDKWWGAALWGLIGALLGQIHMSGFFFAFSFFLCSAVVRGPERKKTRWPYWLVGSVLGAITLKPWVLYVLSGQDHGPPWSWEVVTNLRFWRLTFSDMLGTGLDYSLGRSYFDFLRYPISFQEFYPAIYLQGISLTCGLAIIGFAVVSLWKRRAEWKTAWRWPWRASESSLAAFAAIFIFGTLLTVGGVYVHRHYLHITFPFEGLLLALLALNYAPKPRLWLAAIVIAQLGLSVTFLDYIHTNGGAPGGDYGRAYRGN